MEKSNKGIIIEKNINKFLKLEANKIGKME